MAVPVSANPNKGIHYAGNMDVQYARGKDGQVPEMSIQTDRLTLKPVTENDIQFYHDRLYNNPEAMAKYADTAVRDMAYVAKRVNGWIERFKKDDLFSAFCVQLKDGTRIGHAVLGYGDNKGEAEFALMLDPNYWDQGYGKEITYTMLQGFAPWLRETGHQVNIGDEAIETAPLETMVATARRDNFGHNIFQRMELKIIGTDTKWDPNLSEEKTRDKFQTTVSMMVGDRILIQAGEPISVRV